MERVDVLAALEEGNRELFRGERKGESSMRFVCRYVDVSTMMAFDATQFYEPFVRVVLGDNSNE